MGLFSGEKCLLVQEAGGLQERSLAVTSSEKGHTLLGTLNASGGDQLTSIPPYPAAVAVVLIRC